MCHEKYMSSTFMKVWNQGGRIAILPSCLNALHWLVPWGSNILTLKLRRIIKPSRHGSHHSFEVVKCGMPSLSRCSHLINPRSTSNQPPIPPALQVEIWKTWHKIHYIGKLRFFFHRDAFNLKVQNHINKGQTNFRSLALVILNCTLYETSFIITYLEYSQYFRP